MSDPGQVAQTQVTILNKLGMHARPAMAFVDTASNFHSEVTVKKGDQAVDGKSIMQMMMLAATKGTVLTIEAKGDDADQVLEQLRLLVERHFDEE